MIRKFRTSFGNSEFDLEIRNLIWKFGITEQSQPAPSVLLAQRFHSQVQSLLRKLLRKCPREFVEAQHLRRHLVRRKKLRRESDFRLGELPIVRRFCLPQVVAKFRHKSARLAASCTARGQVA